MSLLVGLGLCGYGLLLTNDCVAAYDGACFTPYIGVGFGFALSIVGGFFVFVGVILVIFPEYPSESNRGPLERLARTVFPRWFVQRPTTAAAPLGLLGPQKFCPECGKRIVGEQKFCGTDGHALKVVR